MSGVLCFSVSIHHGTTTAANATMQATGTIHAAAPCHAADVKFFWVTTKPRNAPSDAIDVPLSPSYDHTRRRSPRCAGGRFHNIRPAPSALDGAAEVPRTA